MERHFKVVEKKETINPETLKVERSVVLFLDECGHREDLAGVATDGAVQDEGAEPLTTRVSGSIIVEMDRKDMFDAVNVGDFLPIRADLLPEFDEE